jgi:hypothetical protein
MFIYKKTKITKIGNQCINQTGKIIQIGNKCINKAHKKTHNTNHKNMNQFVNKTQNHNNIIGL